MNDDFDSSDGDIAAAEMRNEYHDVTLRLTVDQWKNVLEIVRAEYAHYEEARLEIKAGRTRGELEPNEALFYQRCFDRATFLAETTRNIISALKKQGIDTV